MLAGMHAYLYYWIHAKHYLSYLYNGVDAVEDSIEIAEAEGKDEDDDFGESVVKQKALRQKLVDLALV